MIVYLGFSFEGKVHDDIAHEDTGHLEQVKQSAQFGFGSIELLRNPGGNKSGCSNVQNFKEEYKNISFNLY